MFITHFLFFSPLCPNLGHQAHQNNNQSLVETRFNGTPQLSPCKFHEKKCLFSDKIESLAQKKTETNIGNEVFFLIFKQITHKNVKLKIIAKHPDIFILVGI